MVLYTYNIIRTEIIKKLIIFVKIQNNNINNKTKNTYSKIIKNFI